MHKLPHTTGPFCGKSWDILLGRLSSAGRQKADVPNAFGWRLQGAPETLYSVRSWTGKYHFLATRRPSVGT